MLAHLTIDNYALISHVELEFAPGLTIITGETGSGKSIMLGALGLLTGGRADSKVVGKAAGKAMVEARFITGNEKIISWFGEHDLEWDADGIIIRREISSNGRSRSFINDSPVNLSQLGELTALLVDMHTQHENRSLTESSRQLEIIDAFSDNAKERIVYREAFNKALSLRNRIKKIKQRIEEINEKRAQLEFKYSALSELDPKKGELREIERRFEMASRADEIKSNLNELGALLGDSETGIIDKLYKASDLVAKTELEHLMPRKSDDANVDENNAGYLSVENRLGTVIAELRDILGIAEDVAETIDVDPSEMEKLSARMNLYFHLMKQFNVAEADELVDIKDDVEKQLSFVNSNDSALAEYEGLSKEANRELKQAGERLTETRKSGAIAFAGAVTESAKPMGLKNLLFKVDLQSGKFTPTGQDTITFLSSFNKNQTPGLLDKMASGGELSRLMLAIKGVLAGKISVPTVIFDEVDTGVSGEIADKMGEMMKSMGMSMQVIAITHLPQVASKGTQHFKVYKEDAEAGTQTHVVALDYEKRVKEIASMISGTEVTEAALENARLLLGSATK